MVPEAPRIKLTHRHLAQWPDDGRRHELIDGEHFVTASPSTRHQRVLTELLTELVLHVRATGKGQVFPAPLDAVLSDFDVVEPDILLFTDATAAGITDKNIQGAPDLVVEILSASTAERDRGLKRDLYERYGVSEYWMVDPVERTVEVLRLDEGRLERVAKLAESESLSTPLLPDLEIELGSVFRE